MADTLSEIVWSLCILYRGDIKMIGEQINYEVRLKQIIGKLESIRKEGVQLATAVVGQSLYSEDLYILSIIDKCLRLIDGFANMLENRNLTCAGILLRVQIDNCLRTYALYVAADKNEVLNSILDDKVQLNKLRSKDGNRLTDQYLKQQLERFDKRFGSVYKETSGYIHHSEKAFYNIASAKEKNVLELDLGHPLTKRFDVVLQECAEAFLFFVECQYILTKPIVESKIRIDAENN